MIKVLTLLVGFSLGQFPPANVQTIETSDGKPVELVASAETPVRWVSIYPDCILFEYGAKAVFWPAKPGTYTIVWYTASKDGVPSAPFRFVVIAKGNAPEPPKPEPPSPKPEPPKPEPRGPLHVLIIEETSDASKKRGELLASKELIELMQPNGPHTISLTDKDVKDKNGKTPERLAPYIAGAKQLPYCYIVNESGQSIFEGPLPEVSRIVSILRSSTK